MTNLTAMNERMQQWQAEKPGFDGIELKLFDGDVAIVQFVATGDDGDAFIKLYRSHVFPQQGKNGGRFNLYRYCTLQNEGTECVFCAQGHMDIKERMSMWFRVYNLLHGRQPQNKTLPQTTYNGGVFFNEEVNGFKRWDESAWRDSPWSDILSFYGMYGSLHNFIATIICTGQGMQKRYKIFPLPNSGFLPPEVYQMAQQECTPILQTLRAQQQQPVQVNPAAQQVQALQPNGLPAGIGAVAAFSVPGMPAPPPLPIPGMPAPQGMPQPMTASPFTLPGAPQPTNFIPAAPIPSPVAARPDLGLPAPAPLPVPVAAPQPQFQVPTSPPPLQLPGTPLPVASSGIQVNAGEPAQQQPINVGVVPPQPAPIAPQDDGAAAPRMF